VEEEELSLVHTLGPVLEHHEAFPDGVNVEFVCVKSPATLRMRVWERGSGITMACGTGACASAAAAVHAGHCPADVPIALKLDGGVLEITVEEDGRIFMRGPACFAFEGEVEMGERQ
jgi:diaminopimelate epimerase